MLLLVLQFTENNTLYEVSLMASNKHGTSVPVIEEFQTSDAPIPPPPRDLHTTLHKSTSINLSWQKPTFSEEIIYYMLRYREIIAGNDDAPLEYKRTYVPYFSDLFERLHVLFTICGSVVECPPGVQKAEGC